MEFVGYNFFLFPFIHWKKEKVPRGGNKNVMHLIKKMKMNLQFPFIKLVEILFAHSIRELENLKSKVVYW